MLQIASLLVFCHGHLDHNPLVVGPVDSCWDFYWEMVTGSQVELSYLENSKGGVAEILGKHDCQERQTDNIITLSK